MLEVFLVFIVITMALALCLHHNCMKRSIREFSYQDRWTVRKAAEQSIIASNTINPVIALVEIVKAVEMIEGLHDRHGMVKASSLTSIDTCEMLNVLQVQKSQIIRDLIVSKHDLDVNNSLSGTGGF
jgi:hypothetical protein